MSCGSFNWNAAVTCSNNVNLGQTLGDRLEMLNLIVKFNIILQPFYIFAYFFVRCSVNLLSDHSLRPCPYGHGTMSKWQLCTCYNLHI